VALHAVMVAFWLGSLWPLLLALRDDGPHAAALLQRFSRRAVPAVALLLAAGLVIAAIQIGGSAGLVPTRYGLMLLLKLALVGALLLLALDNKRRLTPALAAGDGAAAGRLRRAIRWEIGLSAAILLLTEALGTTPPPRALAEQAVAAEGAKIEATARGYHATITIRPARAGHNDVTLRLTGPDGRPLTAQAVTLVLAAPAAGIAPLRRPLTVAGAGEYRWSGHELALPGRWTLQIDLLVSDFEKVVIETAVDIK
jgi:copper transport protein